jgi:serine/threonine-protein kinase
VSKRKDTPAAPPETPYPSAALLAALKGLMGQKLAKEKRVREAWPLVVAAGAHGDFPVVADFALENELIVALEGSGSQSADGKTPRVATWTNPVDGSQMVWIPPGPYLVGSDRRPAEAKGFSLARHPVTNAQFAKFLQESGYTPPANHPDPGTFLAHWNKGAVPKGREEHPVVWVSFIDALSCCRWASLSLPTEWLWEKAARGSDGRTFPWGEQRPTAAKVKLANVNTAGTMPVGSFPRVRSPYGCEDLVGNVSEWCQMTAQDDPGFMPPPLPDVPAPEVPPGPYAAVRGSCFLRMAPGGMVSWHRRRLSITRRNQWVGFRPACLIPYRPAITS